MAAASAVWYGAITYLAYQSGEHFEVLLERMKAGQRWFGIGAAALVLVALVAWLVRRRVTRGRG
jgi:membrane protein DedA with SNARE-associated domain